MKTQFLGGFFSSLLHPIVATDDDHNLKAIATAPTVSTGTAITRFIPATARHVAAAQAQLDKRREQQDHFFKLLKIREQHSQLDTEANTQLFQHIASEQQQVTQRKLGRYPVMLAIEQSRLSYARANKNFKDNQAQVNQDIADLQKQQVEAGKLLRITKYA